jgi:hypothetical protein
MYEAVPPEAKSHERKEHQMSLWYRGTVPAQPPAPSAEPNSSARHFRAWTESLYVAGTLIARDRQDRLSDILNRRAPITVVDGYVVPLGAPRAAEFTQPEMVLDPFDFDFVLGGRLDEREAGARAARRVHKVRYPVLIVGSSFEIRGTIHVFPGNAPEFATYHTGTLFLPVTNQLVRRLGRIVSGPDSDVVLVNRHAIREIRQLDTLN